MRFWRYIFCLLLPILVTGQAKASTGICEVLLSGGIGTAKPELGTSQADRISKLLAKVPADRRADVFKALAQEDLKAMARAIRMGKATDAQKKLLTENPGLETAIVDLANFSDVFPGIFALANADQTVLNVLQLVRKQEEHAKIGNADLLVSESLAPRLKRLIDDTLYNLIEQANEEYKGGQFNQGTVSFYLSKIGRFISPTYNKVRDLVELAQNYQRQLTRVLLINRLLINLAIGQARELGLTDGELDQLIKAVVNSPEEIKSIKSDLQEIFGDKFELGQVVDIGEFDIKKAAAKARTKDVDALNEKFDKVDLAAMDLLNKILSDAHARKGQSAVSEKDEPVTELQLREEAFERRLDYYASIYRGMTGTKANEEYEVERRYYETVVDGYKDGKAITHQVEHFRTETVTPTFENILDDSFDEGDRSVWKLDGIRERAAAMVKHESVARQQIAKSDKFLHTVMSGYADAVLNGKNKEPWMNQLGTHIASLETLIKDQETYAQWSNDQILRQYSKDVAKVFRDRNGEMLDRLVDARDLALILKELLHRGINDPQPAFNTFDNMQWLDYLRRRRDHNYETRGSRLVSRW